LGLCYAAQANTHRLHTLDLPFTWAVVAIPTSALLMSIHLIRFIHFSAVGLRTGELNLRQQGFAGTGCLLVDEAEIEKEKPAC
jgi:TRAP-type C4-dicarboxylate transport system permease small subunit